MRTLRSCSSRVPGLTIGILLVGGAASGATEALYAQQRPDVTSETIEQWMVELSNRSHMDALCHNSYEGLMYNAISRETVDPDEGCVRLGITNAEQGIVTRGILMDIARLKGVDFRCWKDRTPYDELRYLQALHRGGSPLAHRLQPAQAA